MVKLLALLVALNTIGSNLLIKRAVSEIGSPASLGGMLKFAQSAAASPWIWASLSLQVLGYLVWMVVVSREKLGVAAAWVGAAYYLLTAVMAWLVFGERISVAQWLGILLITIGVVLVSFRGA